MASKLCRQGKGSWLDYFIIHHSICSSLLREKYLPTPLCQKTQEELLCYYHSTNIRLSDRHNLWLVLSFWRKGPRSTHIRSHQRILWWPTRSLFLTLCQCGSRYSSIVNTAPASYMALEAWDFHFYGTEQRLDWLWDECFEDFKLQVPSTFTWCILFHWLNSNVSKRSS